MANNPMIKFLRGSQAGFEGLGTYEAGVFYLTKDTNRLYIGNDDNTASLLNQGVQVVQNVDALPTAPPAHDGDFIYCIDENVLAYYDGATNGWTQINPDTHNKSVAIGATVSGKVATITSSVTDKTTKSDTMTITAGNNVSLSADTNGNLTINTTDTSTTKAGHYTPSDEDETLGTETGKVIHQIKVDNKKHVTKIVERDENRNSAVTLSAANDSTNSNKVVVTSSVQDDYSTKSGSMNISGAGATTVSVEDGNIIISSTDTDTKVTSAENHYTPVADANAALSAGTNKFVTGVSRDAKGHVTEVTGVSSSEDVTVAVANGSNAATVTTSAKNVFGTASSDAFIVAGAGATTVSGDVANKKITVTSTDRSVTEAQYHYAPSEDTNSALDATNKLITKVQRDSKGHVTGITTGDSAEDFTMAAAAAATNEATITGTAKNIAGTAKSGSVTIKGAGATTVSVDADKNVVVSSADTKVTSVSNHYVPSGGTTLSASGGTATNAKATTQVITGITRDAAGHITGVTSAGISDTHNALSSVDLSVSTDKKLNLSVVTTDNTKSDTIALDVKYGKNAEGTSYHTTANLVQNGNANAGKWDLDVYTTAEVDAKISSAVGANGAVQVVGTVDEDHPLPDTNIKTGDTYIVTGKGTYNGQAATSGDMFIASGNHTSGTVASGFWYYIPAGNEAVQLAGRTNGFELKEGNSSTVVGAVEFDAYDSSSNDFQVVAEVTNASAGGYNKTSVSFNMYWGSF